MERKNFTESFISKLEVKKERYEVYDDKVKGLSCRVTSSGAKSFYVRKKLNGKAVRVCLGSYPFISVEKARKFAYEKLNMIADDINPNVEKKKISDQIKFGELFKKYCDDYAVLNTKPRTFQENMGVYNRYLRCFEGRRISSISKEEIRSYVIQLYKEKGNFVANKALKLFRHILNKGIEWGLDIPNPTIGIKKYQEKSRDRYLNSDEIARFIEAVDTYPDDYVRAYFLLSLYVGQRRSNMLSMRWSDIDFNNAVWRIEETKNGEPMNVPLVEQAMLILKDLRTRSVSEWVFPSKTSKSGHYEEPKRAFKTILNKAHIENFRIHDLRRTLGSYEAITGTSLHIIGKSLGHKSSQSTEVYARLSLDPIRNAAQRACNQMTTLANKKEDKNDA